LAGGGTGMNLQSGPPRSAEGPKAWRVLRAVGAIIWEAIANLVRHEGIELSGYMSFMAILALFPFLIFVIALAGFIGQAAGAGTFIRLGLDFVPPDVAKVLAPAITNIIAHPRGDLVTFGILFSIWSASSGVEALRSLLNRCYQVNETRSVYFLRLQSVVFVILGAIVTVVISLTIVLGPAIERLLVHVFHAAELVNHELWLRLRYGVAVPTMVLVLVVLHDFLPNCKAKLAEIWPGALITSLLWLAGAAAFQVYVDNFGTYDVTYGSLGGIVLSLLFFYLAAVLLGFGAEVNAAIMRRRSPRRFAQMLHNEGNRRAGALVSQPSGPPRTSRHEQRYKEDRR
jgi:membrane protein